MYEACAVCDIRGEWGRELNNGTHETYVVGMRRIPSLPPLERGDKQGKADGSKYRKAAPAERPRTLRCGKIVCTVQNRKWSLKCCFFGSQYIVDIYAPDLSAMRPSQIAIPPRRATSVLRWCKNASVRTYAGRCIVIIPLCYQLCCSWS